MPVALQQPLQPQTASLNGVASSVQAVSLRRIEASATKAFARGIISKDVGVANLYPRFREICPLDIAWLVSQSGNIQAKIA